VELRKTWRRIWSICQLDLPSEKQFLIAVERGDMATMTSILEEAEVRVFDICHYSIELN